MSGGAALVPHALLLSLALTGCYAISGKSFKEFRTFPDVKEPLGIWNPNIGLEFVGVTWAMGGQPAGAWTCLESWRYKSRLTPKDQMGMWRYYVVDLEKRGWTIEAQYSSALTATKERYWVWMGYSETSHSYRIAMTVKPCETRWLQPP